MHWLRYLSCVLLEVHIADIGIGSSGGLLASLMTKHVVLHAAQNPKTKYQTDVRSAHIQFYRPIFPAKDPRVQLELREVSIGKGWSTFRVELTQGSNAKVAASADVMQVSESQTTEYAQN
jgi:acyl-CoA thioesterase FadM